MGREGWSGADEPEFDALFDATYPELRRFAIRRVENRAGVEDVLAETFTTAWRRRTEMPDPALPWLFGICHKVIANHRRSAKRRVRLFARLAANRTDLGRDPAEIVAERSEIGSAFARLSESQREVLRLVAWDGLSAADAAGALGCSPPPFACDCTGPDPSSRNVWRRPDMNQTRARTGSSPGRGFQEAQSATSSKTTSF